MGGKITSFLRRQKNKVGHCDHPNNNLRPGGTGVSAGGHELEKDQELSSGSNLKPIKDSRIYRRNLPHWQIPGNAYFISFNTTPGYELTDKAKDITLDTIKFHQDKKYELYACVIMPTHVHIVLLPLEETKGSFFSLAQIMHSIKSYSANRIQRVLGKNGNIWFDENYDRVIRDDNDFYEKMNYI